MSGYCGSAAVSHAAGRSRRPYGRLQAQAFGLPTRGGSIGRRAAANLSSAINVFQS